MSTRPSLWRLLHPRWVLLHVFVVASGYAMVRLGHWQWIVAHRHHGAIQNYSYAFQWWAFTFFAILMWFRVVRDWRRRGEDDEAEEAAVKQRAEQPPQIRYVGYAPPTSATVDTDPERARFNAYLADLDARDREESR